MVTIWSTFIFPISLTFCSQKTTMSNYKGSDILIALGERIKKLREKKGLSLRQLAALCNVDHSVISKIEKGNRNITVTTLFELASGLEVPVRKLVDFEVE